MAMRMRPSLRPRSAHRSTGRSGRRQGSIKSFSREGIDHPVLMRQRTRRGLCSEWPVSQNRGWSRGPTCTARGLAPEQYSGITSAFGDLGTGFDSRRGRAPDFVWLKAKSMSSRVPEMVLVQSANVPASIGNGPGGCGASSER